MEKTVTRDELSRHQTIKDIWIAIHGNVYDVTSFVDDHPGGADVLKDVAGADGTENFDYAGHSDDSLLKLETMIVGPLAESQGFTHHMQEKPDHITSKSNSRKEEIARPSGKRFLALGIAVALVVWFVAKAPLKRMHENVHDRFWLGLSLGTGRNRKMINIYPSHLYFLGLGALGYDQLWGRMKRAGVFFLVQKVITSRVFPNGTPLLGSFTGWTRLDAYATPAVIFYDNLLSISQQYPPYRYLLVSLFSSMQTVAHCMLILGWSSNRSKRKQRFWDDLELAFWGVFNQAWGAAAVYPLYCFTRWGAEDTVDFGPTDVDQAIALVPTALLGSLTPVVLLYPAFSTSCSTQLRQCLIAAYRLTPLSLPLLYRFFAFVTRRIRKSSASDKPNTELARKIVAASSLLSASFSTVGHLYAILSSLAYSGLGGLLDVFWPGRRGKSAGNMLAHAAHTFLQLDVPIISLALIPFADMLLSPFRGWVQRKAKTWGVHDWYGLAVLRWAALGTACVIISNGSVLALALGARCAFSMAGSMKS